MRKVCLRVVWTLHITFLLFLILQPTFSRTKKEHKTLLVKTITPQKPQMAAKTHSAPSAKKAVAAPKKEITPPKKITAPPKKERAIAEKTLAKEKKGVSPPPKPQPRAKISDSLLQELEESLAKIEQKPEKNKMSPPSLATLRLQIDSGGGEESSYIDQLVSYLRQTLSLPRYGEVKIQLSLRQDGSVAKILVLKAASGENRRYLEEHLPHLSFPRPEHSADFILTFVNEL